MNFFKQFPIINYRVDNIDNTITNILSSFILKHIQVDTMYMIREYVILENETPESVSYKLYNDAELHWTILLLNNIIDPFTQWYLTDKKIQLYTESKYNNLNGIHHFVNITTEKILDEVDDEIMRGRYPNIPMYINPVTNYEYELEENEKRRNILIINPKLIHFFINKFEETMKQKK